MWIELKDLSFQPSGEALATLRDSWSWLLPGSFRPILASTMGDVFFQGDGEEVSWLNTGVGEITVVARSRAEFLELLETDQADEWFMPDLIQDLIDSGKVLAEDECYTFVTLPVFEEGRYEVENLNPVPAKEHFGLTGDIHRQIRELPDGSTVEVKVR